MCTAAFTSASKDAQKGKKDQSPLAIRDAAASDVPLGDGLADVAKIGLLNRSEKLRRAMEDAGA